jgi:hypothetical protein
MIRRSVCKIVLRPESLFPVTKLICPDVCDERIKGRGSNSRALVQVRFAYAALPEVALKSSPMARTRLDRTDIPAITTIKRRKQHKVLGKGLSETSALEPPGVIPHATPAAERFLFKERLLRGTVLSRPNRFSMEVDVEGIGVRLSVIPEYQIRAGFPFGIVLLYYEPLMVSQKPLLAN